MLLIGDNRETLQSVPDASVDCCVTSPPYWGLRDYGGQSGQIGLESTLNEYIEQLVQVFREVGRCLAEHGTLFLNLGDSYNAYNHNRGPANGANRNHHAVMPAADRGLTCPDLKPKDLCGVPWRVAFALQADGWFLRQDIIWKKPAPMPSSVKDRCTTAHEYIFLLTKSPRYYWDWYGISEECSDNTHSRGRAMAPKALSTPQSSGIKQNAHFQRNCSEAVDRRNKRSVWTINTESFKGAHFATFPRELPRLCISAGCPETVCSDCGQPWVRDVDTRREPTRPGRNTKISHRPGGADGSGEYSGDGRAQFRDSAEVGNRDPQRHVTRYIDNGMWKQCSCGDPDNPPARPGVVLDPFLGSGTTAEVAQELGRGWIGCELNPDYQDLIDKRTEQGVLF